MVQSESIQLLSQICLPEYPQSPEVHSATYSWSQEPDQVPKEMVASTKGPRLASSRGQRHPGLGIRRASQCSCNFWVVTNSLSIFVGLQNISSKDFRIKNGRHTTSRRKECDIQRLTVKRRSWNCKFVEGIVVHRLEVA